MFLLLCTSFSLCALVSNLHNLYYENVIDEAKNFIDEYNNRNDLTPKDFIIFCFEYSNLFARTSHLSMYYYKFPRRFTQVHLKPPRSKEDLLSKMGVINDSLDFFEIIKPKVTQKMLSKKYHADVLKLLTFESQDLRKKLLLPSNQSFVAWVLEQSDPEKLSLSKTPTVRSMFYTQLISCFYQLYPREIIQELLQRLDALHDYHKRTLSTISTFYELYEHYHELSLKRHDIHMNPSSVTMKPSDYFSFFEPYFEILVPACMLKNKEETPQSFREELDKIVTDIQHHLKDLQQEFQKKDLSDEMRAQLNNKKDLLLKKLQRTGKNVEGLMINMKTPSQEVILRDFATISYLSRFFSQTRDAELEAKAREYVDENLLTIITTTVDSLFETDRTDKKRQEKNGHTTYVYPLLATALAYGMWEISMHGITPEDIIGYVQYDVFHRYKELTTHDLTRIPNYLFYLFKATDSVRDFLRMQKRIIRPFNPHARDVILMKTRKFILDDASFYKEKPSHDYQPTQEEMDRLIFEFFKRSQILPYDVYQKHKDTILKNYAEPIQKFVENALVN